ncbi:hypothetical protein KEM54_003094 [Ascosphaera aggregata]|nr:hypothetical protein KEM54_003094 [Ascosphaera aggregata]
MASVPNVKLLKSLPVDITARCNDSFIFLRRQEKEIEKELQLFLDIQSAGLHAQISGSVPDDASPFASTSSSMTFEPSRTRHGTTGFIMPVRQPESRRLGLNGARKGVLRGIERLLMVKEEERHVIDIEIGKRDDALADIDSLISRRRKLEESMLNVSLEQRQSCLSQLVDEKQTLEEQIHRLKAKLMNMEARHQRLTEEIAERQSSADSRMSSYKASMSLLESESRSFLRYLPFPPTLVKKDLPPFYALNPARRTLEMARDQWGREKSILRKRQTKVDDEIDALHEGGSLWQETMVMIYAFEGQLRNDVASSEPQRTRPALLSELHEIIRKLENALHLAELKHWNLLICCIGAELATFQEAQKLMVETEAEDNTRYICDHLLRDSQSGLIENAKSRPQDGDLTQSRDCGAEQLAETTTPFFARSSAEIASDCIRRAGEASGFSNPSSRNLDHDDEPDPAWL